MIFFSVLCVIFLVMFFFPIGIGMAARQFESKPLFIQQANSKNPRYFSASFVQIFDKAWPTYDGSETLHMSREEQVIEADKIELIPHQVCPSLVYAEKHDFFPPEGISFEKEIYVKGNARLEKTPLIRAIACMGDLDLGAGTSVIRWADAEGTLRVDNDCDLGISTSSGTKLLIGENCCFKRLYAPVIWLGKKYDELDQDITPSITKEDVVAFSEIIRNIKYVDDRNVNEGGVLKSTIITKYDLTVLGNYIVQGHIRSLKNVKIDDKATVHGNIFAEGNIFIGSKAKIFGVVFSQENIYVDDGVVIGQPQTIKSMIARGNILFGHNCRVYGYIGTEGIGKVCPNF